jgi:hypothetical protein
MKPQDPFAKPVQAFDCASRDKEARRSVPDGSSYIWLEHYKREARQTHVRPSAERGAAWAYGLELLGCDGFRSRLGGWGWGF